MSDTKEYTFTSRPFNERWRGYTDRSGNLYEEGQFRSKVIPASAYPVSQKIEGEYGEPIKHKLVVVPTDIWQDTGSFPTEFKTSLITIPKDIFIKSYDPPPVRVPTKVGYVFIAEGSSFNGKCPRCGQQMGGEQDGWTTHYACLCGAVLDLHHGDMGGCDHWEFFEPSASTSEE